MRYVVYGAGGIGGAIGARLFQHGHDVVLICRGAHLEKIRAGGLKLRTPDETATLKIAAAAHPSEIDFTDGDVVLLTMKSQDTLAALDDLRAAAGVDVPVICAQNGVANERMAARLFARVYAMLVLTPATFLEPGEVLLHAAPVHGVLDAGRYPSGVDALIERVCADITACGFSALPDERVLRLKYGKLLTNIANSVQALCGLDAAAGDLVRAVRDEAIACYAAAGIEYVTPRELNELRGHVISRRTIEDAPRGGGSSWQSMMRGLPTIETDYLNGEITLLGALHGVPTPYNRVLQVASDRAVRERRSPGGYSVEQLTAMARQASAAPATG